MQRVETSLWRDARVLSFGVALGALVVLALALAPFRGPNAARPGVGAASWREIPWPLPVDPWWPSKAFTCTGSGCGAEMTLYVRAKIGFCNCKTGVADDEELERIGDFGVVASAHAPTAEGRPIEVAWMKGRSRPYTMTGMAPATSAASALLVGYNDRCDAIVATAMLGQTDPLAVERSVLEFLRGPEVMRWAERTLGL